MPNPPNRAGGCTAVTVTLRAVTSCGMRWRRNIDIAHSIPVGHAKRIFVLQIVRNSFEPSARARIVSGIDQRYPPWLGHALVHLHSVLFHIESDVRHVQEIIREIFLDEISLVSAANNEIVDSVLRIHFQDVPQDRLARRSRP